MLEVFRYNALPGFVVLYIVPFLLIRIPYLPVLLGILSSVGLCVVFKASFSEFFNQ